MRKFDGGHQQLIRNGLSKPRKRGGKASKRGLSRERVRGELHIQTVNSRHDRFKDLLRRHRGVATKYLDSYLKWFHLAVINADPSHRACLNAALGWHA